MYAPPPRHAQGHRHCSRHWATASQCLAKHPTLQPCVRRCQHWRCSRCCAAASRLLAKPRRCSHVCTTATSRPRTLGRCVLTPLQPCARCRHVTPGDIGAAAATAPLRLDARQNARHCSHVPATTTSRLGTSVLQLPLCHCVSTPSKTLLRWAKHPAKCPALW
jgi:hypothetical protein